MTSIPPTAGQNMAVHDRVRPHLAARKGHGFTRDRILTAALFAAGFALLFRGWLFSGFDRAFGDDEDGYLALAHIEHWRHVFAGEVPWRDPLFFYPVHSVLGYTDAFFLFGAVSAPLRFLGLDTFTAVMAAMATLAALGFFGLRRLAMRWFGTPASYAALGAFLFAFANVDAVKLIHIQAYCAMLLPLLCALAFASIEAKPRSLGVALAAGAGLLYAALFLTAYQTAWFFGCYVLLMALIAIPACGVAAAREIARKVLHAWPALAAGTVTFAVGMVPFTLLYGPVVAAGHARDFAEVAANMPDWRDLANVTPENAVWGRTLQWIGVTGRLDRPAWEVELAFTPVVLAVFIAGLAAMTMRLRQRAIADRFLVAAGFAVVIGWLLQMDYFGFRPWEAVWAAVPGAKAIRYTFRSQLVANLFVALVAVRVLAGMTRACAWSVLVCGFLVIEQVNLMWPPTTSRREALAWIAAAPAPPVGCDAFYVAPKAGPPGRNGPQHQDDAMLFAEVRGIATVNGYSSWFPDGWALQDPARPGYPAAVRDWAERNRIADRLCRFDPRAGQWTAGPP